MAETSFAHFAHRPITPGTRRIRLIEILPKKTPEDVIPSCNLIHFDLDDPPPYVALSYVWGDTTRSSSVLVNGTTFKATQSLADLLCHLVPQEKPLTAWVDALCIDQDNEEEKSVQVGQMAEVYRRASFVLCWLGLGTAESRDAMLWIQKYGSQAHQLGIGNTPALRLVNLLRQFNSNPQSIDDSTMRTFLHDIQEQFTSWVLGDGGPISALYHFFERPYWNRMWVVQEVVLGKTVHFRCGDLTVCEEDLHHTLRLIRNFGIYQSLELQGDRSVGRDQAATTSTYGIGISTRNPINLLKLRRAKGPYEFVYLIRSLRHFKATDPRDRIFSLLSFAFDVADFAIQPDYNKTYHEVYVGVSKALIERGFLDILSICIGVNDEETPELPSWVPDLTKKHPRAPLQQRGLTRKEAIVRSVLQPPYCASGAHSLRRTAVITSLHLEIEALYLGDILGVGNIWKMDDDGPGTWLADLEEMSKMAHQEGRVAQLSDICRAAVADQEFRSADKKPRLSPQSLEKILAGLDGRKLREATNQMLDQLGLSNYCYEMQLIGHNRRPISISSGNLFGLGPKQTRIGDSLYIIIGANVPFILRRTDCGNFRMVGEAYVHSIMDGEATRDVTCQTRITII
ncbi:heterokaryon incompatibility protein-domain-containing protein [Xylaria arbuscula]|nr:heterokaryon incompatibility protein-domain-containing protein [Xylaria arbuscula]